MAQQQVLPVGYLTLESEERLRRGLPAATAEEYLYRVRLESQALPDVVEAEVAEVPRSLKPTARVFSAFPETEPILPCPKGLEPSERWVREQLAVFAELRQYLTCWSARGVGSKTCGPRQVVPALKDEAGWHILCVGYCPDEEDTDDGDEGLEDAATAAATEVVTTVAAAASKPVGREWAEQYPTGRPPTVQLMLQFDQVLVLKVLSHHAEWLKTKQLSRARAAWIYGLLARLEKPLVRESAAVVHELMRRCCAQKVQVPAEAWGEGGYAAVDLLIAITSQFFGQGPPQLVGPGRR